MPVRVCIILKTTTKKVLKKIKNYTMGTKFLQGKVSKYPSAPLK